LSVRARSLLPPFCHQRHTMFGLPSRKELDNLATVQPSESSPDHGLLECLPGVVVGWRDWLPKDLSEGRQHSASKGLIAKGAGWRARLRIMARWGDGEQGGEGGKVALAFAPAA
jgi:hypothetical protein